MKRVFIFTILLLVSVVQNVKADQLAWITKDQAEKCVTYFTDNKIKEVILFCGCCEKDSKVKVTVSKVSYRQVKNSKEYYEVVIEGTTSQNKKVIKAVDLAYVYIKKDTKSACLGLELEFECDPCSQPFDWF